MGTRSSKCVSSLEVQQNFGFENLHDELKLMILALLPYKDLSRCITLNKSYQRLIVKNWPKMKKVHLFNRLDVYVWSRKEYCEKACCSIKYWENCKVSFSPTRAYTVGSSRVISAIFREKKFFKRFYRRRHDSFSIDSIAKGFQRFLDYTLSKANPHHVDLCRRGDNDEVIMNQLLPILKMSFKKYGTKTMQIYLARMEITHSVMELINITGSSFQCFECSFEDNTNITQIIDPIYVYIISHSQRNRQCDPSIYQAFLENWKNGLYPRFCELFFDIHKTVDLAPYIKFIRKIFEQSPTLNEYYIPNNMEFDRYDGWKLTLVTFLNANHIEFTFTATLNGQPFEDLWPDA